MFDLENEHLAYGEVQVLRGIDLHIAEGEQLALIGPSGAGKTSLLRRLYGLAPEAAFIHQDHALVGALSVFHNVLVGRADRTSQMRNLLNLVRPGRAEREEILALLTQLGVAEKLFEKVAALSGGQQQRVAVARALYRGAPVLLADEPVSGVDPHRAGVVLDLLRAQCPTLVLSLHSVRLAQQYFPRLVGLREGRILFDRPSADVNDDMLVELYRPC